MRSVVHRLIDELGDSLLNRVATQAVSGAMTKMFALAANLYFWMDAPSIHEPIVRSP
jgi:hypothetical protein